MFVDYVKVIENILVSDMKLVMGVIIVSNFSIILLVTMYGGVVLGILTALVLVNFQQAVFHQVK